MPAKRLWIVLLGVTVVACGPSEGERWDFGMTHVDYLMGKVPWFSTMRNSVAYRRYELPRLPAEGAIPTFNPYGDVPPPFTQAQLDSVAPTLTNPLPVTPAVLARGEVLYERHCFSCHGISGAGDGPVVGPGKFPYAPPVNQIGNARSPGYVYAIIRVGRGLMPAYGNRMPDLDRWAVVHYVEYLQQQTAAGVVPNRYLNVAPWGSEIGSPGPLFDSPPDPDGQPPVPVTRETVADGPVNWPSPTR